MIFYILYRIGNFLALNLPLKFSYAAAVFLADIHYMIGFRERNAVIANLKTVMGKEAEDDELKRTAKAVFRNFAKYLVDFFRFSLMDAEYVKRFIKLDGLHNIDEALKKSRGVIAISAHLGNWELGGAVLGMLGYNVNAVVLTHQNRNINDFFKSQRAIGNMKSIEFGASLRRCYIALKSNEILALLGDRDFSRHGVPMEFCGKTAMLPKGPAVLSCRTGAVIVPSFITRNSDDTFTFTFGEPISPEAAGDEDHVVNSVMAKYMRIIEYYIKKYPGQWYVFRDFWNQKNENMRPDTII